MSILLARWLEPPAYGAFSTAFALFLLLGTLHTALWTEPMLVYGSGRFRGAFSAYQAVLIRYHWRFGLVVFVAFLLLGGLFWSLKGRELALSLFGLSVAAPAVLYLWLVRRGAYVLLNPRLAALGGGLYLLVYLSLAGLLLRISLLNEATAFLAMALSAGTAAEVIRGWLGRGASRPIFLHEVRALHWNYGRWALLAGALSWVPGNLYFVVLPAFHGLEAAAAFKALTNLIMPVLHFNGALGQLLIPGMVRAKEARALGRFTRTSLALLAVPALGYWILLLLVGPALLNWLYAGKYVETAPLLSWLGLIPILAVLTNVLGARLRALEYPRAVAVAYGASAVVAGLGVAVVWHLGLKGAIVSTLFSNAATAGSLASLNRRVS
ncbi:lipopolysaccharide biosynthesis protein [Thermus sp.]|uniref:lipopolysaccharide biosynthesis protein n=1 Tax=Thermus sp. TaxID=275 RepID=UPI003D140249